MTGCEDTNIIWRAADEMLHRSRQNKNPCQLKRNYQLLETCILMNLLRTCSPTCVLASLCQTPTAVKSRHADCLTQSHCCTWPSVVRGCRWGSGTETLFIIRWTATLKEQKSQTLYSPIKQLCKFTVTVYTPVAHYSCSDGVLHVICISESIK